MLRETAGVRQIQGEPPRRWFADDFFDLIVWLAADVSVNGFQLCDDRGFYPRALNWTKTAGYSHDAIDDGEARAGAHKSSPALVSDGALDTKSVFARFERAAGLLPEEIRKIVGEKIKEFPDEKKF